MPVLNDRKAPVKKKVVKSGEKKKKKVSTAKGTVKKKVPKKATPEKKKKSVKVTKSKTRPSRGGGKRKILYPQPSVEVLYGKAPLTASWAKELLGWTEETEKIKFGADFLIKDDDGKKIRCLQDVSNRPIYPVVYETLKQEILRGNWELNMENRIIGRTGLVLNGQHTFIALVLANQVWKKSPEDYPFWGKKPPTLETTIAYGCSEEDKVVNTIDTCRPRSLSDVIYRSPYFVDLKGVPRKRVARMVDYATRLLWIRTGASLSGIAPKRTHAEALDFIAQHPRILECVSHIYEEDEGKEITRFISPGYASGFLYLMGSSTTDPTDYRASSSPSEKLLDWSKWDQACEFFVDLGQGSDKVKALRRELGKLLDSEYGASQQERWALLSNGWLAYVGGKTLTAKSIALKYDVIDDVRVLKDLMPVGGIDIGEGDTTDDESVGIADPTPEQVEKRKRGVKTSKQVRGKRAHKDEWNEGDTVWVNDPSSNAEPYFGKITVAPYLTPNGWACEVQVQGTGEEWEALVDHLQVECPATTED